jgi:hypothetical protein
LKELNMRVTVIPMSSGEYDVQIEKSEHSVENYVVARPATLLRALGSGDERRIIAASFEYLLEHHRGQISHVLSLDKLWNSDRRFAEGVRKILS